MFSKRSSTTSFSEYIGPSYNANILKFIEYHKGKSEGVTTFQSEAEGIQRELPCTNLDTFQHFQSHKNKTLANNTYPLPNEADIRSHRASIAIFTERNLSRIPSELLTNSTLDLQLVDLSKNKIVHFPQELLLLSKLKSLKLDHNRLRSLPYEIFHFTKLECLSVSYNQIDKLPETLSQLINLCYLDLESNLITSFSKEITALKNLQNLNLMYNRLSNIPTDFVKLTGLTEFCFEWFRYVQPQLHTNQKGQDGEFNIRKLQIKCSELQMNNVKWVNFETFVTMLSSHKIDFTGTDICQRTMLHTATLYGDVSVINYLATSIPYLLTQEDQDGLTPLSLSILSDKNSSIEALLKYPVNFNKGGGKHGSLLHISTKRSNLMAVKELLKLGEDPNKLDAGGNCALHYAISFMIEGHPDAWSIAQCLLENGSNPNIRNKENWTPLHLAIRKKNPQVLEWIISHNFEVQEIHGHGNTFKLNKQGGVYSWTGLHIATYSDNPELIFALGEAKINPFKRSLNGFTAKRIMKRSGLGLKLVEKFERDWIKENIFSKKKINKEESIMNLHGLQAKEIKNASKNIFKELVVQQYPEIGFGNMFKPRMGLSAPVVSSHKTMRTGGDSYDVIPENEESSDELDIETIENELQYINYCSDLNEDGQLMSSICQPEESVEKRQKLPDSARQQTKQFLKGKFETNSIQVLGVDLECYQERLQQEPNFTVRFCQDEIQVLALSILNDRLLLSDKIKALFGFQILHYVILEYIYKNYSVPFPREYFSIHIKDHLDNNAVDQRNQLIKNRMNQINLYYELVPQSLMKLFHEIEGTQADALNIKFRICNMLEEFKYLGGIVFFQNIIDGAEGKLIVREARRCQMNLRNYIHENANKDQSKQAYYTFLKNQYAKVPSTKKHLAPIQKLEKMS